MKAHRVTLFTNGNTKITDKNDEQISDYQRFINCYGIDKGLAMQVTIEARALSTAIAEHNAGVIAELERRGDGNPTSAYVEGIFDGYDEAIALLKEGDTK